MDIVFSWQQTDCEMNAVWMLFLGKLHEPSPLTAVCAVIAGSGGFCIGHSLVLEQTGGVW